MKAVAKLKPEPGAMALIDVDRPVRRPGEVLIQISAGGICGTDVAIWKWHEAVVGQYAPQFPLIVGHEFAGTVVESTAPGCAPRRWSLSTRRSPAGTAVTVDLDVRRFVTTAA
jgi:threonine dehydrogenase-like Zn-dependent dehydrogenase